jgi:predicted phage terminase large subunit-like protein
MRHAVPPKMAAIEKKSTGVTLTSVLSELRGLNVRAIERSRASGSKTQRFLTTQPFVAAKLISFTKDARHADNCILHMSKITANDSHRHDDIADTLCDAVRIAFIDKTILYNNRQNDKVAATILQGQKSGLRARSNLYGGYQNS